VPSLRFLPFRPEFEDAIRSGRKTVTTRTRRYGKPGDILDTPFGPVRLGRVERTLLAGVVPALYHEEGFDSPQEFIEMWTRLHPRKGFVPEQWVWVHEFEFLGETRLPTTRFC
jgi:hypothetical protein